MVTRKIYYRASLLCLFMTAAGLLFSQDLPYRVTGNPWNDTLGNHRAVLQVDGASDSVVYAAIPWRRRDPAPETKAVIVTDSNGVRIKELLLMSNTREWGRMIFRPVAGAGKYYVYYLPYKGTKGDGWFKGNYTPPYQDIDAQWAEVHRPKVENGNGVPHAKIVAMEARTAFDSFFPMEVIATEEETREMIRTHPDAFLVFPEDRTRPVKMTADLPYKWVRSGPLNYFKGEACRNEYYVFQLALFASRQDINDIKVRYVGNEFPLTCFNLEGRNAKGEYFTRKVNVQKGKVQALWFGVDIPSGAKPGEHTFTVVVTEAGGAKHESRITIRVLDKLIADRGDGETWRGSRLRWLNSTLGIDDSVPRPYTSLQVHAQLISGKTADVRLATSGLPASIVANGKEILQQPMAFAIETDRGIVRLPDAVLRITKKQAGIVSWESTASDRDLTLHCSASMEPDGYLHYRIRVSPRTVLAIKDMRLEMGVRKATATYFMGMGLHGMDCPQHYDWTWKGPQNAFWIGNADAGVYCKMLGAAYEGPMLNLYHPPPPPAWYNDNKGGFLLEQKGDRIDCSTYSGERTLEAGKDCEFEFSLLVTPVKTIDTHSQFTDRYYHNGSQPSPSDEDVQTGIGVINVHHASSVNPYINYPFLSVDTIRAFTNKWHKKGVKVKLYYTIRELSNQVTELWALRSLGNEVLGDGKGGGYIWLREHLGDHYNAQWFTPINGYEACDAALLTSGESRWYNYYIEGLRWLIKNTDIDGLYLDDVAYGRDMLKRMRKVMDRIKPGCIIDLHSNTEFSIGPATQYTEFFPYINKLWFGEHFWYDKMDPANWIVESSGIPFGLMGDMLQSGGNPWRGMVYGMTVRYPWFTAGVNCDPRAIWKIWDKFGIADARMVGYWKDAGLVRISDTAVRATAYVKDDGLLVAVASWAKDTVRVKLDIDWAKIGWRPEDSIWVPGIEGYQKEAWCGLQDRLELAPTKGLLLWFRKKGP